MRMFITIFLTALLAVSSYQLYKLYGQQRLLSKEYANAQMEFAKLNEDNKNLQADLEYYSTIENLAKDFKSKFDYKRPGERMIIIVPNKTNE